jgi:hypothetical protein
METYRLPESGVVMREVRTGKVLAYASYVAQNEKFDVNTRAGAPAASIFKMVTGAAFVEKAGLNAVGAAYAGGADLDEHVARAAGWLRNVAELHSGAGPGLHDCAHRCSGGGRRSRNILVGGREGTPRWYESCPSFEPSGLH